MNITKKKLRKFIEEHLPSMDYEGEETWEEIEVGGEFFDVNLFDREVFDLTYSNRCTNNLRVVVYDTEPDPNNTGFRTTALHLPEVMWFNTSTRKVAIQSLKGFVLGAARTYSTGIGR